MTVKQRLEIFCGTGGVGKTTTAASRAYHLCSQQKKVLLITIDPSLRLKQFFGLTEADVGTPCPVPGHDLDVFLMSPKKTLTRILGEKVNQSHILKSLSSPHSGLNEILALIELREQWSKNHYDVIILDTPPGRHFIDFLSSAKKVNSFFDHSFLHFFSENKKARFFSGLVEAGLKKLLSYLEKLTGEGFIESFIISVNALYNSRHHFLEGIKLEKVLTNQELTHWYFVSSIDQQKSEQGFALNSSISSAKKANSTLVLNKSLFSELESWQPQISELVLIKDTMLKQELNIKKRGFELYDDVLLLPEILNWGPEKQVEQLSHYWESHSEHRAVEVQN